MSIFYKYIFENTNDSGHHIRNFYVIDKQCFVLVFSQYNDGNIGYVVNVSHNIGNLDRLGDDYVKINFSNDIELLTDVEDLYKKVYKLDEINSYVWQSADLKETPKIILPIVDDAIIYSPLYKNIILGYVSTLFLDDIDKQHDYFKTYNNISEAFKDPVFLSYTDVLDEIWGCTC